MITVNDKDMQWEEGITIRDVLQRRRFSFPMVVVRVNGQVVRRKQFDTFQVKDGDEVKVLHLMGGG